MTDNGYVAAMAGTLVGACALGGLGFVSGGVGGFFLAPAGLLAGGILGCYVGLRSRDHARAGLTAWLLVPILIASAVIVGFADTNIGGHSKQIWLPAAICSLALPVVARWLATRTATRI